MADANTNNTKIATYGKNFLKSIFFIYVIKYCYSKQNFTTNAQIYHFLTKKTPIVIDRGLSQFENQEISLKISIYENFIF